MADRYKKIEFKKFSDGLGQEFFELEKKFYNSSNIAVKEDTKKIKLLPDLATTNTSDETFISKQFLATKDYIFFLTETAAAGKAFLQRTSDAINWATASNFAVGTLPYEIFSFQGKILAWIDDGGTIKVNISNSDDGGSFTQSTPSHFPASGAFIATELDNVLYMVTKNTAGGFPCIAKSNDGITYTELFHFDNDVDIEVIFTMNEWVHFVYKSGLYRIENDKPVLIRNFSQFVGAINIGKDHAAVLYGGSGIDTKIQIYDGETFEKTITMTGLGYMWPLFSDENYAYFKAYTTGNIYKIDKNGRIFALYTIDPTHNLATGAIFKNMEVFYAFKSGAPTASKIYRNSIYKTSGNLETSIFSVGEIVPKQIIVRHKPLPANTSVKIYQKFDRTANYTLILTSDTDGAVKKKYTFPAGTIIDYGQFKIELITSDTSATPEDVELEFLYLPVGLENAK